MIKAHRDALFSYQKTSGHTYRIYYIGDAYFADYVFKLTEQQKKLAELYAANLELFLYGSQFGSVSAQVSEDVLKYGTLVKKCAEKYGISNFTDVINAVMMAESGGRGTDVMQASECPYNQKYRVFHRGWCALFGRLPGGRKLHSTESDGKIEFSLAGI